MIGWPYGNIFIPLKTIAHTYQDGFTMRPEVYDWLDRNQGWDGPDRFFVNDSNEARLFETWYNIYNEWAKMIFNHPELAYQFLLEFTNLTPEHKYQVRISVPTHHWARINDIVCSMASELIFLAQRGLVEDKDFVWTMTKMSYEDPDLDEKNSEIVFSFLDLNAALMFKLSWGGS
jgi:hypothetical protein